MHVIKFFLILGILDASIQAIQSLVYYRQK